MTQAIMFDLYGVLALNGWQAFKTDHFTGRPEVWDEVFQIGRRVDAGIANYIELIRFTAQKSGESEATVRHQLENTQANQRLLDYIASNLKPHYKIGMLSNASSTHVIDEVFTESQRNLFDSTTFSHQVGNTKPNVDMYTAAAERLGVEPAACVFVDDQERHAAGARAAGMQALVYHDFDLFKTDIQKLLA